MNNNSKFGIVNFESTNLEMIDDYRTLRNKNIKLFLIVMIVFTLIAFPCCALLTNKVNKYEQSQYSKDEEQSKAIVDNINSSL